MSETRAGIDQADLLDADIVRIGAVYREMNARFMRKSPTKQNLSELQSWATDAFFKIGLVAKVDVVEPLLGVGPPTVEIIGHVPGHEFHEHGLDHDRKKIEVLASRERGEKYYGEKDGKTI